VQVSSLFLFFCGETAASERQNASDDDNNNNNQRGSKMVYLSRSAYRRCPTKTIKSHADNSYITTHTLRSLFVVALFWSSVFFLFFSRGADEKRRRSAALLCFFPGLGGDLMNSLTTVAFLLSGDKIADADAFLHEIPDPPQTRLFSSSVFSFGFLFGRSKERRLLCFFFFAHDIPSPPVYVTLSNIPGWSRRGQGARQAQARRQGAARSGR
jgi:hypothetical protein